MRPSDVYSLRHTCRLGVPIKPRTTIKRESPETWGFRGFMHFCLKPVIIYPTYILTDCVAKIRHEYSQNSNKTIMWINKAYM